MKKVFVTLFLGLLCCNAASAESYYFKECKLSEKYTSDHLIDFEKNVVKINFKETQNDDFQQKIYTIESITGDQIVTKKKQNIQNKEYYFQYYLDVKSKLVSRQIYIKKCENCLFELSGPRKLTSCTNVKANWDKSKKENVGDELLKIKSSLSKCKGTDFKKWTNCKGIYKTDEGYKYIGEWQNGSVNGEGIETWKDGRKYVGKFENDLPHGHGTFTYADGSKYVGEFKGGKKDGQGTLTLSRGDKYVGKFKDDQPYGKGIYKFASGKIYSGQFKDGKISEGTGIYINGTKYVGKFKDEQPHGHGTFTYSNGRKYIGQFVDGYEHGKGICVSQDGTSVECEMEKGYFVK